jgi:hypothetical protein
LALATARPQAFDLVGAIGQKARAVRHPHIERDQPRLRAAAAIRKSAAAPKQKIRIAASRG